MFKSRKFIGLAVREDGITAVEVVVTGAQRSVMHTVDIAMSGDLTLNDPIKLGRELRGAMRTNGFTASQCVIGLMAKSVIARDKTVPATDENTLRGILSIATEREFAGAQEMVFDYCTRPDENGATALLGAAQKQTIEQVTAMARSAGLRTSAVTSSACVLAKATKGAPAAGGRLILSLLPQGVELVVQTTGGVQLARHLPVRLDAPGSTDALGRELRRVLVALPNPQGESRAVLVWDLVNHLDGGSTEAMERAIGMPVKVCKLAADLELNGSSGATPDKFAQAAALASCDGKELTFDFLHSRLAPRRKTTLRRKLLIAGAVSAVVIAGAVYIWLDWRADQEEIARLSQVIAASADDTRQAREFVERASFASGWYGNRLKYLDCWNSISECFPEPQNGRMADIWVLKLSIVDDARAGAAGPMVTVDGKAVNQEVVQDVIERLKRNPALTNVKPGRTIASATSKEVSFAIDMNFRGGR